MEEEKIEVRKHFFLFYRELKNRYLYVLTMLFKRVTLVFYKKLYRNVESRKIIMFEVVIFVIINCLEVVVETGIIEIFKNRLKYFF